MQKLALRHTYYCETQTELSLIYCLRVDFQDPLNSEDPHADERRNRNELWRIYGLGGELVVWGRMPEKEGIRSCLKKVRVEIWTA